MIMASNYGILPAANRGIGRKYYVSQQIKTFLLLCNHRRDRPHQSGAYSTVESVIGAVHEGGQEGNGDTTRLSYVRRPLPIHMRTVLRSIKDYTYLESDTAWQEIVQDNDSYCTEAHMG